MDWKTIYSWRFSMHLEFECMPARCYGTNVTTVDILLYFIHLLPFTHLQCGKIMSLVYVLVDILDGLDGSANLDIDMTIIFCREKGTVRDDITIVKDMATAVGVSASATKVQFETL